MSQSEARAWWADVEHLRETIERRRESEGGHDARKVDDGPRPSRARRFEPARRFDVPHRGDDAQLTSNSSRARRSGAARDDELRAAVAGDEVAGRRRARGTVRPAPRTPADRRVAMQELAPRAAGTPRRRTIEITGRTVPAPHIVPLAPPPRARRRAPTLNMGVGPRPDRIAMWAVVLGFVLIVVAAMSANG